MRREAWRWVLLGVLAVAGIVQVSTAGARMIGINVVLKTEITDYEISVLGTYGRIRDIVPEIKAVTVQAPEAQLRAIQALPFVLAANPDAERSGAPIDTVEASNFLDGNSTWDLDTVNVTPGPGTSRSVGYDGTGVFVAVLDTGLLDSWRQYFPQQRIAAQYARCFGGGGMNIGEVSEQPNKWEHDQNSHGTHVTSTILGYSFYGTPMNGAAPMATVIPVKVLNQNGGGWSSVIARGIVYVANLKAGVLAEFPVVINMSLGGGRLDAMEKAAIDYAIEQGVIVVAAAGNYGTLGMIYPAAYEPVISVGACGWVGEWSSSTWWYASDVPEGSAAAFYVPGFSSRQKTGQDLDVLAPGTAVVGPYQYQSGKISYYFLTGTSMSTPHVSGIVALMTQKNTSLTAADVEAILEATALAMPAGSRFVPAYGVSIAWGNDANGSGIVQADAALAAVIAN